MSDRETLAALVAWIEAAATAHKRKSSCCGERDACGTCAAPACMFGDVQRALHDAAAALRARMEEMGDD